MDIGFNPEVVLEHNERAAVLQTVATPGYAIVHKLMRSQVDKFIVSLINTHEEDDAAIIARHKLVKAAAQFYQAITDRINHELAVYRAAMSTGSEPVDMTEGILEIGPLASTYSDVERDEQLYEGEGSIIE